MRIEGVIFDLDGTLVHTIEDIMDAANAMFTQYGLSVHQEADYLKWIGNGAIKLIENALSKDHNADELQTFVATFKDIYSRNLHNKSRLYVGIPRVLNAFTKKGIKLSILSNKPDHLTKQVAAYYLSDWPFTTVFGQRKDVPRKPDPSAALEIAGKMNSGVQRIMFVGDSDNDMLTAQAAGMIPVGVTWGYGSLGTKPIEGVTHYIHRPEELIPLVINNEI